MLAHYDLAGGESTDKGRKEEPKGKGRRKIRRERNNMLYPHIPVSGPSLFPHNATTPPWDRCSRGVPHSQSAEPARHSYPASRCCYMPDGPSIARSAPPRGSSERVGGW